MKAIILGVLLSLAFVGFAVADCPHNGRLYPTDTVIGPLICGADGKWYER